MAWILQPPTPHRDFAHGSTLLLGTSARYWYSCYIMHNHADRSLTDPLRGALDPAVLNRS
jgi:hypothetical protein